MEELPKHPLLIVTQEDVKKARQFYDLGDAKRIRESLDSVKEWCNKQEHLVEACKYLDYGIMERLLLLSRGSVEGMKRKIDRLFTTRGMMPELMLYRTVKEFEKYNECVNYVPLPKLCPTDQSRVMLTQFVTDQLDELNILTYFRYCFLIGEYRLYYDYNLAERYVIDLNNLHLHHLSKLNPVIVKKSEVQATEGFGTRIKGIHILNAPPFVDKLVFLLKQALREKVASRLHVHSSYEDFHKHIPKEILPSDYKGDGPSCSKLAEQWKEVLKTDEARKIITNLDKLVSDETKRHDAKFNEEYMGMPGSFRKLTVD